MSSRQCRRGEPSSRLMAADSELNVASRSTTDSRFPPGGPQRGPADVRAAAGRPLGPHQRGDHQRPRHGPVLARPPHPAGRLPPPWQIRRAGTVTGRVHHPASRSSDDLRLPERCSSDPGNQSYFLQLVFVVCCRPWSRLLVVEKVPPPHGGVFEERHPRAPALQEQRAHPAHPAGRRRGLDHRPARKQDIQT